MHTVIRKDLVEQMPAQRIRDILDYHSSVEQAATADRAGVDILVLTHHAAPDSRAGGSVARPAGRGVRRPAELGSDLLRVPVAG